MTRLKSCHAPTVLKTVIFSITILTGQAFLQFNNSAATAASLYQHVLLLSVDGLRDADIADPLLQPYLSNIKNLQATGVTYTNAFTSTPSDSFPGELNYLTGASPKTTGVYYDNSYSRSLLNKPGGTAGTGVLFDESIDKNSNLLSGGGDFGKGSIDSTKLPVDSTGKSIYPHNYLNVNTIFEVAHEAGLHTALIDKHPAYDLANGPSGKGVDDFYAPEINAKVALENGKLVDRSTAQNSSNLTFKTTTKSTSLTEAYDDLKVNALLNQIAGKDSQGTTTPGTPAIFGMNFQALSVAQKDATSNGGIATDGTPSPGFIDALQHTDTSIGNIISALKVQNLFDSTLVVLTAKHGQNPRQGTATLIPENTFTDVLEKAGISVNHATQDDIGLFWLAEQNQVDTATNLLNNLKNPAINEVLSGNALKQAGFGNPLSDDRTPDLIIKLNPGYVISDSTKRAEHGGFSDDDTHVALIAASGTLASRFKGTIQTQTVKTTQVAVTALDALGLDPESLQGAVKEGTKKLPGLGISDTRAVPEPDTSISLLSIMGLMLTVSLWRRSWGFPK
ncbi:alkaline phosphatase family protein [Nostocaceae cyanobacterium CENA369]|uniref:Alkaline phosphatase family protein n=1 Tax=Dendronalium phyllosphericum CENA369 TaxID=1725256 RepID=A0A8J7IME1_9NOST|nr:alkaline phosphatase family protein [Dendronalium phyllosphericum]MBH8576797.1 alkaline phosphatase family protein [Dendronalium phyllosphericum CENA369]